MSVNLSQHPAGLFGSSESSEARIIGRFQIWTNNTWSSCNQFLLETRVTPVFSMMHEVRWGLNFTGWTDLQSSLTIQLNRSKQDHTCGDQSCRAQSSVVYEFYKWEGTSSLPVFALSRNCRSLLRVEFERFQNSERVIYTHQILLCVASNRRECLTNQICPPHPPPPPHTHTHTKYFVVSMACMHAHLSIPDPVGSKLATCKVTKVDHLSLADTIELPRQAENPGVEEWEVVVVLSGSWNKNKATCEQAVGQS